MAKHDRRKRSSQPRSSRTVSIQVPLPVLGVLNGVREAFHGLCIKTGMQVLEAMMEGDREDLCSPKGRHQAERPAWRGGSVASQVTLGGRQVAVPRLRVRRADGEAPLPSFQWAAATDPLDEHTLSAVAAGVSTRRYAGTLDPAPAEVTERGTSSSAVSRRFVALSAKRLRSFLSRGLGELDLRVVCIDGKVFRDHCMVVALGIDTQGRKHVLGCARQTGGGWPVKVRRKEGVTNHLHPESCAGRREAAGEALTGARMGRAGLLSIESVHVWSAETVPAVEGHTDITATGEGMEGSTVSENPSTSVRPSPGPGRSSFRPGSRTGAAEERRFRNR